MEGEGGWRGGWKGVVEGERGDGGGWKGGGEGGGGVGEGGGGWGCVKRVGEDGRGLGECRRDAWGPASGLIIITWCHNSQH
jgi:hypothetical protein